MGKKRSKATNDKMIATRKRNALVQREKDRIFIEQHGSLPRGVKGKTDSGKVGKEMKAAGAKRVPQEGQPDVDLITKIVVSVYQALRTG